MASAAKAGAFLFDTDIIQHIDIRQHMSYDKEKNYIRRMDYDVSAWKRAMHCQVFRNSVNPQYCVTFHVDITNFLSQVKKRGFSFTFSFVYAVTKCANEIEEFRCRFVEGKPAIFETIHTSFTYLDKSTELFKVINVPMQDKMKDYVALAKETEENQTE